MVVGGARLEKRRQAAALQIGSDLAHLSTEASAPSTMQKVSGNFAAGKGKAERQSGDWRSQEIRADANLKIRHYRWATTARPAAGCYGWGSSGMASPSLRGSEAA